MLASDVGGGSCDSASKPSTAPAEAKLRPGEPEKPDDVLDMQDVDIYAGKVESCTVTVKTANGDNVPDGTKIVAEVSKEDQAYVYGAIYDGTKNGVVKLWISGKRPTRQHGKVHIKVYEKANPKAQVVRTRTVNVLAVGITWGVDPIPTVTASEGWDPLESTCRHASLSIL